MSSTPISAYAETRGMIYFARMLNKIRLNARGDLRRDFLDRLGDGFDGRCAGYLRIAYSALVERVLAGGTDEEILEWCFREGRELDDNDIWIWNNCLSKVGWNDAATEILEARKKESGLENRQEIQTMVEYFEYDEGRKR